MKLVVDTSIIFSLFKPNSFTNKLLREFSFELFSPPKIVEELVKYSDLICSKAGILILTELKWRLLCRPFRWPRWTDWDQRDQ